VRAPHLGRADRVVDPIDEGQRADHEATSRRELAAAVVGRGDDVGRSGREEPARESVSPTTASGGAARLTRFCTTQLIYMFFID